MRAVVRDTRIFRGASNYNMAVRFYEMLWAIEMHPSCGPEGLALKVRLCPYMRPTYQGW